MKLTLDGRQFDVQVEGDAVIVDGQRYQVALKGSGLTRTATVNGRTMRVDLSKVAEDGGRTANVDGKVWQVSHTGAAASPSHTEQASQAGARPATQRPTRGAVAAQMTGRVLRVEVSPGDRVQEGTPLLVLEAMKMENEIRSPRAGTIRSVAVAVGDRVNAGDPLVVFEDGGS